MDMEQKSTDSLLQKRKRISISPSMKLMRIDPSSYHNEVTYNDTRSNNLTMFPDSSVSTSHHFVKEESTNPHQFSLSPSSSFAFEQDPSSITTNTSTGISKSSLAENDSNYRRFSGRVKKQTDFFAPKIEDISTLSSHNKTNQRKSNQITRRELRFKTTTSKSNSNISNEGTLNQEGDCHVIKTEVSLVAKEPILQDTPVKIPTDLSPSLMYPESKQEDTPPPPKRYPVGTLVWGKLPGYEWWPGCIISYDKKDLSSAEKGEEEKEEEGEGEGVRKGDDKVPWVKWFGDNQLSQLAVNKMHSFSDFIKHLSHTKLKGLYKKALFSTLKEAAKRCSKEFSHTGDDRRPSWIFYSSLFPSFKSTVNNNNNSLASTNTTTTATITDVIIDEETPLKVTTTEPVGVQEEEMEAFQTLQDDGSLSNNLTTALKETELNDQNSPLYSPDSSTLITGGGEGTRSAAAINNLFTSLLGEDGSRQRVKSGQVSLTSLEKELLHWALDGFQPTGPDGFNPRLEDHVEIRVLQAPSSTGITTHCRGNQLVTSEGGTTTCKEEIGGGGEKREEPRLILVHMKNKAQFELVHRGQINIEDICIACGRGSIVTQHPLFKGGLCKSCKETFMENAYLFDEDGSQMYCTICSDGNQVFMCDTPNCSKVYCSSCIEKLCGPEERMKVQDATEWQCYICSGMEVGQLRKRDDWDKKLHDLFLADNETEYAPFRYFPPIPAEERKPLRVLGLFDGVGTGFLVLKELGFQVEAYVASEIDPDAIKVSLKQHPEMIHLGAIEKLTEEEIRRMGPFDLVFGGSPCNDLSIVNPARKGIYDGTGRLFFEFFRVLSYARPHPEDQRPFFWLYENVVSMRAPDKKIISRFLQCNPVVVDARDISAAHRARYFWGNIPGMNRPAVPLPGDRLTLQECLEPNCFRQAQFEKLRTITTKMNSIKQTKKAIFPVRVVDKGLFSEKGGGPVEEEGDVLWCTEMERLFGFPDHYTDVANLGRCGRQKLLGKAWSVPVVRHLLSPLKDYFQSNTTRTPVSNQSPSPSDIIPPVSTTTITSTAFSSNTNGVSNCHPSVGSNDHLGNNGVPEKESLLANDSPDLRYMEVADACPSLVREDSTWSF